MFKLKQLKDVVSEAVDEYRDNLIEIARYLYENPELGSGEYKAYEFLTSELEKNGFRLERKIFGMPTAFSASFSGKREGPRVAVIAEYDALPDIGHGTGKNLIAASALGAGIAVSKAMTHLPGEVLVVGTPDEEGHGPSGRSKVLMVEKGFWDTIDAVIMLRPSTRWSVGNRTLGIWTVKMEFEGRTSHAAFSPHEGVNALNAAALTYIGTHMLRQQARRDADLLIHGIISEGGRANYLIPDRAVCEFGVRSSDDDYLKEMVEKVIKCAEGAAVATGAQVKIRKMKRYSSKRLNLPLIKILWQNYKDLGVPVKDWIESIRDLPMASMDFGDVSQRTPAADSYIKIAELGTQSHSKQFAEASITPQGLNAMIMGAKALALTLTELLAEPKKIDEVRRYLHNP
jgi:amidohydrolase